MATCKNLRKLDCQTGAGLNSMPNVRIDDFSDCYLRFVEAAYLGDSPMIWVEEGRYLIEK